MVEILSFHQQATDLQSTAYVGHLHGQRLNLRLTVEDSVLCCREARSQVRVPILTRLPQVNDLESCRAFLPLCTASFHARTGLRLAVPGKGGVGPTDNLKRMSYAHGGKYSQTRPLFGQSLRLLSREIPDKEAVVFMKLGVRWTYAELQRRAEEVAQGLLSLGLSAKSVVGLFTPNTPEMLLTFIAASLAGFVVVPIPPAFRRDDLRETLRKMECEALIVHSGIMGVDFVQMVLDICPELQNSSVGHLQSSALPALKFVIRIDDTESPGCVSFRTLYGTPLPESHPGPDPHSPGIIVLTSGSTGAPKGVSITHHQFVHAFDYIQYCQGSGLDTRYCAHIPLVHITSTTIVAGNLLNGATIVFPDIMFNPVTTLDAVEQERCDTLTGTAPVYFALIAEQKARPRNITALKVAAVAGDLHPPELIHLLRSVLGLQNICIGYGASEAVLAISATAFDVPLDKTLHTQGTVVPNLEVKIVGEQGELLPVGELGEVCIRGPQVFRGYWKDPEATQVAIDAEGWYHTGDLAIFDEDMFIRVKGRKRDIALNKANIHVFMSEVEAFLMTHPDIAQCSAIGLPDGQGTEDICAWIKMKPGKEPLTTEAVQEYGKPLVAHYKIPNIIRVVDSFPMTHVNKISKVAIKKQEMASRPHL